MCTSEITLLIARETWMGGILWQIVCGNMSERTHRGSQHVAVKRNGYTLELFKPGFHMTASIIPIARQKVGRPGRSLRSDCFHMIARIQIAVIVPKYRWSINRCHLQYLAVFGAILNRPAINRRLVLAAHLFIVLAALWRRRAFQESTISRPNVLVLFFCFSGDIPNLLPIFQFCICPYTPCWICCISGLVPWIIQERTRCPPPFWVHCDKNHGENAWY